MPERGRILISLRWLRILSVYQEGTSGYLKNKTAIQVEAHVFARPDQYLIRIQQLVLDASPTRARALVEPRNSSHFLRLDHSEGGCSKGLSSSSSDGTAGLQVNGGECPPFLHCILIVAESHSISSRAGRWTGLEIGNYSLV